MHEHIEETEAASLRPLKSPAAPTQREIEEHEISHCPYRSWCRFCVMGRGKADPHQRHKDEESAVAIISCDYCFMGTEIDIEESTKEYYRHVRVSMSSGPLDH